MSKSKKIYVDILRAELLRRIDVATGYLPARLKPRAARLAQASIKKPLTVQDWIYMLSDHPRESLVRVVRGRVVLEPPRRKQ